MRPVSSRHRNRRQTSGPPLRSGVSLLGLRSWEPQSKGRSILTLLAFPDREQVRQQGAHRRSVCHQRPTAYSRVQWQVPLCSSCALAELLLVPKAWQVRRDFVFAPIIIDDRSCWRLIIRGKLRRTRSSSCAKWMRQRRRRNGPVLASFLMRVNTCDSAEDSAQVLQRRPDRGDCCRQRIPE